VTFLTATVELERPTAIALAVTGLACYAVMCPFAGMVCDRLGRRRTIIGGAVALAVAAIPSFALIATGDPLLVIIGLVLFGAAEAPANVTLGVLLVELFPAKARVSGSAFGFNLAQAVIGGPGPFVAAALAASIAVSFAPALYVVLIASVSAAVLMALLPETGNPQGGTRRAQRAAWTPAS
jgi:MFS transporter, MHS family, proline/betaine transporter